MRTSRGLQPHWKKGKLHAQTIQNLNQGGSSTASDNTRNCNAVTTLRSGKQFENSRAAYARSVTRRGTNNKKKKNYKKPGISRYLMRPSLRWQKGKMRYQHWMTFHHGKVQLLPLLSRSALLNPNKGKNFNEIGEILRKVTINIPLLDAINQIPSYAKYLKDLCTVKRQLNVRKKAFSTEHVNTVVQHSAPLKLKDPGSPTITCVIGTKVINDALLDLGSSVNLMPYFCVSAAWVGGDEAYCGSPPTCRSIHG